MSILSQNTPLIFSAEIGYMVGLQTFQEFNTVASFLINLATAYIFLNRKVHANNEVNQATVQQYKPQTEYIVA